jgi:hypothetical protein
MARADVYTLLPLDTYARIMNLNPLHFNGARLPDVTGGEPFTLAPDWSERPLWHQYGWQNTNIPSRDELARAIQTAEIDIANFLGYWPAPMWISQEVHSYARPAHPEMYGSGVNVRGQFKSIKTNFAKIIAVGKRKASLIATATVAGFTLVYSDPNLDGWNTLATITVPTTVTDIHEIKLYFANHGGSQLWEIRPLKSVSISGGSVTITVDSWLLLDPDVVNAIPTGEVTAINASTTPTNYVSSVEVRREYVDITDNSATAYWEREPGDNLFGALSCCPVCGGLGCEACSLATQDICLAIRNAEAGIVVPASAQYDSTDARWEKLCWTQGREPDQVKIWYKSGLLSEQWLQGYYDEIDSSMARTIAILATARLGFQPRAESGLSGMIDFWQRNLAESGQNLTTVFTPQEILNNPFGTREGEVQAFRALSKLRERKISSYAFAG